MVTPGFSAALDRRCRAIAPPTDCDRVAEVEGRSTGRHAIVAARL
jgi:hypothetical protein